MDIKVKITVLGLVFILSTAFFWLAINEYLLPSKAQLGANIQIVPHATEIECNPNGACYLHIIGSTDEQNGVAGVTGHIQYGGNLDPVQIEQSGPCASSSYGLNTPLQFTKDEQKNILTFSVGALSNDADLKGGNECITTVVFNPVAIQNDPEESKLVLAKADAWKVGGTVAGQKAVLVPNVDTSPIRVNISSQVPIPSGVPSPSGPPLPSMPPAQCDVSKGDCTCDFVVNLTDWEELRSTMHQEGGSCDINGDGIANAIDISIWLQNNSLIKPVIIE